MKHLCSQADHRIGVSQKESDIHDGVCRRAAIDVMAALDADEAVEEELRNVARSLVDAVRLQARGAFVQPGTELSDPRSK